MNKTGITSIKEIFQLFKNGKQYEGVELLYSQHYNKMYGIAFSIVNNEEICKDVVHNVVYKLMLLDSDKFPSSNELTWLYTVVKNETLSYLRKNKPTVPYDELTEPISEDNDIKNFVDMDAYYNMIKKLNDKQRQVVTLKVLGGYTHKEISKMLDKPIGTIQWIYNTSIAKIKITLTSLIIAIVFSACGFIKRLENYIARINSTQEMPGMTIHIPFDYSIIIFAVLFIFFSLLFVFIFQKSHKIPTKASKKNV